MLNLQTVLAQAGLTPAQLWGTAAASAVASRHAELREAVIAEAQQHVEPGVIDDALAAAALMAMNNVYYRFRHLIGKETYSQKPARLRMQRIAKPATSKADFELFCLAVSAINGCETCMRSHEEVVLAGGITEDQVHDAVRVAATIQAAAVSLEIPAIEAVAGRWRETASVDGAVSRGSQRAETRTSAAGRDTISLGTFAQGRRCYGRVDRTPFTTYFGKNQERSHPCDSRLGLQQPCSPFFFRPLP